MTSSSSYLPVPSEFDDEIDDADLPPGYIWAYPCKLSSCPDYGKSWQLRSNFMLHLMEQEAHEPFAKTPAARRATELDRRYTTDPDLPPRAAPNFRSREDPREHIWTYSFKDVNGKTITARGTLEQMEEHQAKKGLQAGGTQDGNTRGGSM